MCGSFQGLTPNRQPPGIDHMHAKNLIKCGKPPARLAFLSFLLANFLVNFFDIKGRLVEERQGSPCAPPGGREGKTN